ncbi:MAG: hypothetical protein JST84_05005 [Acidobacteria bacterium]|nr:hypothetical protein [Acidobacteriota bacterium]
MPIPTPTELRNRIAPILAKGHISEEDKQQIRLATSNPEATLTVQYDPKLATKWKYKRLRDTEKILAISIWLKGATAVKKVKEMVTQNVPDSGPQQASLW